MHQLHISCMFCIGVLCVVCVRAVNIVNSAYFNCCVKCFSFLRFLLYIDVAPVLGANNLFT